jgi:predicted O-linked N-acetylglucosamine transferase (SPINDLY family)
MPQPLAKSAATSAAPFNVPQALAQALAFHRQGKLTEAERLYADILAVRPEHIDALQMMGLVKLAKGEAAEALKLVSAAMGGRKPSPQLLLNHGLVLNALARHGEALESFDAALKQKSKFAEAHNNRGAALAALGRDEEALASYRKAVAIKPDYAEAHYNAGSALRALGRMDEALASYERALARRPNYAKAHNNRGAVLEALGRLAPALESYDKALALSPRFAEARRNRCRVLCLLERFDEALAAFGEALAFDPGDAETYLDRGRVFIDLNRNDDAAADFRRALALKPDDAAARLAACFAELPILYAEESEIGRRRRAYEEKLRALCADVDAGRLNGGWSKALAVKQPFLLAYQGESDRDLQALYGALVSRAIGKQFGAAALPPPPAPGEPVRIGVVSSFFYLHSNWKIPIKGWLGQLDRTRFKIFGYHTGTRRDGETDAAASLCDRFVHRTLDVAGWRREILADAPHVLIYPGLWMDTVCFQLAAQRLARVQCNSWGHPETGGMATLDYFLSSDLMEPPGAEAHYTEKLVRLPNLSIYYEPAGASPEAIGRAELGLRDDAAVFWCGQSLFKYLPQYDAVFARIARAAPHSQFAFVRHGGGPPVNDLFRARLDRAFAAEGLKAEDHCVFLPRLSQSRFAAAMGLCDVFLDSIGWSGCNSALESLPHDLPIVTLRGGLMRGRHSAAILEMLGVTDTIAATVDDFVAIAARLATDPAGRQALSRRMAEGKPALYRDRACIAALADFLDAAARRPAESAA